MVQPVIENKWKFKMLCYAQLLQFFENPWSVAHQDPLSMDILQAGILDWIAMPSIRGSSQPRDQTFISCIGKQILSHWPTWKAHFEPYNYT